MLTPGTGAPYGSEKAREQPASLLIFKNFLGTPTADVDACGDALGLTFDDQWSGLMASLWAPVGVSKSSS